MKNNEQVFLYNTIFDSSLIEGMNPFNVNIGTPASDYRYEGKVVPRVTSIIHEMLHDDALMGWANWMGFKKRRHVDIANEALEIGTEVHEAIQKFLSTGEKETFYGQVNANNKINAFVAFLQWWEIISKNNIKVLMVEQQLVSRWFAGTLDMLIEINGMKYLVDFKTSKRFSYEYHLQLAAYRRLLYTEFNIIIDGAIILRLSKQEASFQEQLINLRNYNELEYMNMCDASFISLVYAYYNRHAVMHQYSINYA